MRKIKMFPKAVLSNAAFLATILVLTFLAAQQSLSQISGAFLESLQVEPSSILLTGELSSQRLRVLGLFSDGSRRDITSQATFRSANRGIAAVNTNGLVSGFFNGSTSIEVIARGRTASAQVRVALNLSLSSLSLEPQIVRLVFQGQVQPLSATGRFSDDSVFDLTSSSTGTAYRSSNPAVVQVDADGRLTAVGNGAAAVIARNRGRDATSSITVDITSQPPEVSSIAIAPDSVILSRIGQTASLRVEGTVGPGSIINLTSLATYSSSDVAVASVDERGVVRANSEGEAIITATFGELNSTSRVTVSILSPFANTVVRSIPIEGAGAQNPASVAIGPDGTFALVANESADTVSRLDLSTSTVLRSITVGRSPASIAIAADGRKAYVANRRSNTVSVIDLQRDEVVATLLVGTNPRAVAISPDGAHFFVATDQNVMIFAVAGNSPQETFPSGPETSAIAITPDGAIAIAVNRGSNDITIKTLARTLRLEVLRRVDVGQAPVAIDISPDGAIALVANHDSNSLSVIDLASETVSHNIELPDSPTSVKFTPDGSRALATMSRGGLVAVLDLASNSIASQVQVGLGPSSVAMSLDGSFAAVSDRDSDSLSIITNVAAIRVSTEPFELDPTGTLNVVRAQVIDSAGKGISDVPVSFTATDGNVASIIPASRSDAEGRATTLATLLSPGASNIRASSRGFESNTLTLRALLAPARVPIPETPPQERQPFRVALTLEPDFSASSARATAVVLDSLNAPLANAPVIFSTRHLIFPGQTFETESLSAVTDGRGRASIDLDFGRPGTVSFAVNAQSGSVHSNRFEIDLLPLSQVDSVEVSPARLEMTRGDPTVGGSPAELIATISPPREGIRVNFFSSDPTVLDFESASAFTDRQGRAVVRAIPRDAGAARVVAQAKMALSSEVVVSVAEIVAREVSIVETGVELVGGGSEGQFKAQGAGTIRSFLTAMVAPPQPGVEVRFTSDDASAVRVDTRAFTNGEGIARTTVEGLVDGTSNITAFIVRAPSSDAVLAQATNMLPAVLPGRVYDVSVTPSSGINGAVVEAFSGQLTDLPLASTITLGGQGQEGTFALLSPAGNYALRTVAQGFLTRVEQKDLRSGQNPDYFCPLAALRTSGQALSAITFFPNRLVDRSAATVAINIRTPGGISQIRDVRATFAGLDITGAFLAMVAASRVSISAEAVDVEVAIPEGTLRGVTGEFILSANIAGTAASGGLFIDVPYYEVFPY